MPLNSSISSSNQFRRFAVRVTLFCILVFTLDRAIGFLAEHFFFKTRDGDTGGQINDLLEKKPNVIVFGSSRAESHYVPDIIESSLGARVFNAGFKGSNALYDYGVQQLILDEYTPKLIIYDFTSLSVQRLGADPYEKLSPLRPYWKYRPVWNLISDGGFLQRLYYISRIYPYNSKMHSIAIFSIIKRRPNASNGYVAQSLTMNDKPIDTLGDSLDSYDRSLVAQLDRFIVAAHDRRIKLVLVVSPRRLNGTYRMPALIQQRVDQFGIPVLDFNLTDYPEFGSYRLFRDQTHLNHEGAKLFSRLLGERVKELEQRPL